LLLVSWFLVEYAGPSRSPWFLVLSVNSIQLILSALFSFVENQDLDLALGFIRYEGSCGLFMGGFLSFLDVIEPLCYDVVALWSHIQDHISYCIYHVCISLIIAHIILHIMISECRIRVSHIVTVLVLNILLHELN
jgi:hypothetical protein